MRRPARAAVLAVSAALVLAGQGPAWAQEDPVREAQAWVDVTAPAVRRGDWDTARANLAKARKADPKNVDVILLLARVHRATGESRKAAELLAEASSDARALTERAAVLLFLGDVAGSEAAAREALRIDENSLPARVQLGAALEETGRREAAVETYAETNSRWARREGDDRDEDLLAVARARLGVFRCSDEYRADVEGVVARLESVLRKKDPPEDALLEAGNLYLKGHRDLEAKKWFKRALDANPRSSAAIMGLSRQLAFRYEDIAAAKEAERALRENPENLDAHAYLALTALGDDDLDRASKRIDAILAVNPEHGQGRSLRAALAYLRGDRTAFDAEVRAILERNRFRSSAFLVLSTALEQQRRFPEALEMAERAAQTDPLDWDAYFAVGRNALNTGDEAKAEKYLREAAKSDGFPNVYRTNFLKLFRAVGEFPRVKAGRFDVRIPPEIESAYAPLVTEAMEKSLAALEAKWGMKSGEPVHVSIYERQDDFAARTIGLPGFPALGACFGLVVTLDSPRALPPGAFGWRATLHHEFAHVITLQLSRSRVPRWLTEGISVYEERKVSPVWNREMERELVDAIAGGDVLTLADVNNAFRGPRVLYAYYQGGLMCELIERDFGFPKLRELVRLYGDGLGTPDAVKKALGVSAEEFDARFLAWAKDYVKDVHVLQRPSDDAMARALARTRKDASDADAWTILATGQILRGDAAASLQSIAKLAALRPDTGRVATLRALVALRQDRNDQAQEFAAEAIRRGDDLFDLRMALAGIAKTAKDVAAQKAHLERAIELYPQVTGPRSPRIVLSELLLGEGEAQLTAAMRLLEAHVQIAEDDFAARARLAAWYRDNGRDDDEIRMLEELRDIVPLPHAAWKREAAVELHERLAKHRIARKEWPAAELAARTAAAVAGMPVSGKSDAPLDDPRRSALLTLHGTVLRQLGRADDARRVLDEALRLDPTNEAAGVEIEALRGGTK